MSFTGKHTILVLEFAAFACENCVSKGGAETNCSQPIKLFALFSETLPKHGRSTSALGKYLDDETIGSATMGFVARVAFVILTGLMLSGCIRSKEPLLPLGTAVMPLESGNFRGGYSDDREQMRDSIVVTRKSGEYAVTITRTSAIKEEGKASENNITAYSVRFHRIDEHHYVAQIRELSSKTYVYGFVAVAHDMMKFYAVNCAAFFGSPTILRAFDFAKKDRWCEATTFKGLVTFMREVRLQPQLSKYARLEYAIALYSRRP